MLNEYLEAGGDEDCIVISRKEFEDKLLDREILANEIKSWAKEQNIEDKRLKVLLPSGTGTTALYLQKFLPFELFTCSCVGDDEYLKKQFLDLEEKNHPKILKKEKKYHFGKLYFEFYLKHLELKEQTNIEFDLLYDSYRLSMMKSC